MKRAVLALAALLMAASIVLGVLAWRSQQHDVRMLPPPPTVDAQKLAALHGVEFTGLDGRQQSLTQWRGKVLVVNYWATWCHPCREEIPLFSALQARYASRGVQFVGIAADDADKVREFVRQTPPAYPQLLGGDAAARMTADFGNTALGLPFTLVIERSGALRTAVLGRIDEVALAQLLDDMAAR